MQKVLNFIKQKNMFEEGEIVGVACSGGIDSISLLHFLHENKEELDIEVVAINVDHRIRENSASDSAFVAEFCRENRIRCHRLSVDSRTIAKENKYTLEEAARIGRYGLFDALLQKGIVDKIALGHHVKDQVETILLNIFRGCGLKGASGMEPIRGKFVRPFLNTTKEEIITYAAKNTLSYVDDETNFECDCSRNLIRNKIMPLIQSNWPNIEQNIMSFASLCKMDDEYISNQISYDSLTYEKNCVKVPLSYFLFKQSVKTRIIRHALEYLNHSKDIERKHLEILCDMAQNSQNGTKISLPNGLICHKEYDSIALSIKKPAPYFAPIPFKTGEYDFADFGQVKFKKIKNFDVKLAGANNLLFDAKKLPKNCVIRMREEGDIFTPYKSSTKKLKDYFIDKKIPQRQRSLIPLIACEKEILAVVGYEISDKIKIDSTTTLACEILKK